MNGHYSPDGQRPGHGTGQGRSPAREVLARIAWALPIGVFLALLTCTATNSRSWIDRNFPGFVVMPNRVIASAGLPHWTGTDGRLFQHVVVAVNGTPVATSADVYARVAHLPAGTPVHYALAKGEARVDAVIRSMRFTRADFTLLFGAYLLNGALFGGAAILLWWRGARTAAQRGALALCATVAVFALTGADLYGPHRFYRLYVASEALLPAAVMHLALVFPRERLSRARAWILGLIYACCTLLAVAYEAAHFVPVLFTTLRNVCAAGAGVAAVCLLVGLVRDAGSLFARGGEKAMCAALMGAVAGLALPAVLLAASGLTGGAVGVTAAAFTAFLLPLSLGFMLAGRSFVPTVAR